ncbi:hypothetical protein ACNFR6_32725, partial [Streptomyces sp. ECR3]
MSWQQQPEGGAHGGYGGYADEAGNAGNAESTADGAADARPSGGVRSRGDALAAHPIVYHPDTGTRRPEYDRYADPAAAHGWQNAYDETRELPRIVPPAA